MTSRDQGRPQTGLENPVFVCGCHRSGTTLVQSMLDRHPKVRLLPETKLLAWLWSPWKAISRHPGPELWSEIGKKIGSVNRAWALPENGHLLELLREGKTTAPDRFEDPVSVMEHLLVSCNQPEFLRIGEKTPLHIYHVDSIMGHFQNARIVVVERDLRGAFHSQAGRGKKSSFSYRPFRSLPFLAAWRQARALARHHVRTYGADRVYILSFEQLLEDPSNALGALCEFLEVPMDESMLEIRVENSSFEEQAPGISRAASDRWRSELPVETAESLAYLGDLQSGEAPSGADERFSPGMRLRLSKMVLRLGDFLAVRWPRLLCYAGRDPRYRKYPVGRGS